MLAKMKTFSCSSIVDKSLAKDPLLVETVRNFQVSISSLQESISKNVEFGGRLGVLDLGYRITLVIITYIISKEGRP